jgi:hypothetical protein
LYVEQEDIRNAATQRGDGLLYRAERTGTGKTGRAADNLLKSFQKDIPALPGASGKRMIMRFAP